VTFWSRWWFAPGPASTLGLCRALFFTGLCLWQIPHDYSPWGTYSSVLWMPIWLFDEFHVPLLSATALHLIQTIWKVSLVLGAIGLFTRASMSVAFVLGIYLMGMPHNFGQTQHFDTLAVFVLLALALSRAGDAWSIDALISAWRRRSPAPLPHGGEYTWPIRFVWVAMALIFCAAGISKLRRSGLEWIFSDNLAMLLRRQQYHISDGEPLTSWGLLVADHSWLAQFMAAASVTVETTFPLALFSRTARMLLVPAALSFLIGIRVLMGPTFEQFMICFVFWLPWQEVAAVVRAHLVAVPSRVVIYDGGCGLCTSAVAVLTRLDLLRRLEFADMATEWSHLSAAHPTIDRDACLTVMHVVNGCRIFRNFDAYRALAWALPLGWVVLPLLYLPGVATLGRRVYSVTASRRTTTTRRMHAAVEPVGSRRTT
jgi:predicted DCC family thiol-disulfide oxidoreductase YuxK